MLVDTHAHLNFADFQKDLDKVIKRSVENDVTKIICVSSNISDSEKAIEIANLHDIDVKKYKEHLQSALEQVLDALGITFDEIKGIQKMDAFF